jgi:methionyl aminopeptidase
MGNGMVFAIEPMISMGSGSVEVLEDDWTVVTSDDTICAHWEHTVALFNDKVEILTDPIDERSEVAAVLART